jgi:hypothetical protein
MRFCLPLACLLLANCTPGDPPPDVEGNPMDAEWAPSLRAGDVMVLVPGTGAVDYLQTPIEAMAGDDPLVDPRANKIVASDSIVFEQALGAAERAGITDADVENRAVTFLLWGAGFTRLTQFEYLSFDGVKMHIEILGGRNSVAAGLVDDNLINYTQANALVDATDLYARTQGWLAAHPNTSAQPRHVINAAHSWGGAVAEYLAYERDTIVTTNGPMTDGATVATTPLTLGDGVPGFLLGYTFPGPGLRGTQGNLVYEVDRPDDPVHAMNPSGNSDGHNYDILVGSDFLGSYGITTEALACAGVAGECALPVVTP